MQPSGRDFSGQIDTAVTARSLFDYRLMFGLEDEHLFRFSILDVAAGSSPFGAQVRQRGGDVVSVDPLYDLQATEIGARVTQNLAGGRPWLAAHAETIDWDYLGSPDAHIRASEVGADLFFSDYTNNRERYIAAALPDLPFADSQFSITLSANLLFVYGQQITMAAHVEALIELARVTQDEVRVHPVADPAGVRYPHLDEVRAALADHGIETELRSIDKAWIIGGRHTLICRRAPIEQADRPE